MLIKTQFKFLTLLANLHIISAFITTKHKKFLINLILGPEIGTQNMIMQAKLFLFLTGNQAGGGGGERRYIWVAPQILKLDNR